MSAEKRAAELLKWDDGDAVFFAAGNPDKFYKFAGEARTIIGRELKLVDENRFEFCWIVDFPMYEWNEEEKKIDFSHNPFSMPQGGLAALEAAKSNEDLLALKAYQYDIVCNGVELSSGAIRNHLPDVMVKAFDIAGYDRSVLEAKFGGMLNALQYGAPPHGGIAPGIDRIVMLLAGATNLRDVIMFPMNQQAQDLLMGAPSEVTPKQLRELHIRVVPPDRKGVISHAASRRPRPGPGASARSACAYCARIRCALRPARGRPSRRPNPGSSPGPSARRGASCRGAASPRAASAIPPAASSPCRARRGRRRRRCRGRLPRPVCSASAIITASATIRPPVRSRLRRMRPASTISPSSRKRDWRSAPPVAMKASRDRRPFELPGAGGALVVGGQRVEHQAGLLAHDLGRRDDELAGDGVALLRHGRGGAAARHERLEGLADLGLHHQHHVGGDLGERAGDERQQRHRLRHPVAGHVPGRRRPAELELVHQRIVDGETLVAERGQRAGGARELADQHARLQLCRRWRCRTIMPRHTAAL